MVIRYICRKCGAVLYEVRSRGKRGIAVPTPSEVIAAYRGTCPRCGSRLSFTMSEWIERIRVRRASNAKK